MLDILFDKRVGKQKDGLYRPQAASPLAWLQCGILAHKAKPPLIAAVLVRR